jgi:hypothetical protein
MITIAAVAVLMAVVRFWRVDVILFLAVVVGVVVEFVTFSIRLWPGTSPKDQYLRRIKYRPGLPQAESKLGREESVG